mmetsp:Transcript_11352/g.32689  ORF Transcript_11352/g.32689 Transcript_11352/m.32689 type:complete len:254 (-) Transcript_11352:825-1586(-)
MTRRARGRCFKIGILNLSLTSSERNSAQVRWAPRPLMTPCAAGITKSLAMRTPVAVPSAFTTISLTRALQRRRPPADSIAGRRAAATARGPPTGYHLPSTMVAMDWTSAAWLMAAGERFSFCQRLKRRKHNRGSCRARDSTRAGLAQAARYWSFWPRRFLAMAAWSASGSLEHIHHRMPAATRCAESKNAPAMVRSAPLETMSSRNASTPVRQRRGSMPSTDTAECTKPLSALPTRAQSTACSGGVSAFSMLK